MSEEDYDAVYNEGYIEGYNTAQREYEGVTIDGLKATMEVMEGALVKKDMKIIELETVLEDVNKTMITLVNQLQEKSLRIKELEERVQELEEWYQYDTRMSGDNSYWEG